MPASSPRQRTKTQDVREHRSPSSSSTSAEVTYSAQQALSKAEFHEDFRGTDVKLDAHTLLSVEGLKRAASSTSTPAPRAAPASHRAGGESSPTVSRPVKRKAETPAVQEGDVVVLSSGEEDGIQSDTDISVLVSKSVDSNGLELEKTPIARSEPRTLNAHIGQADKSAAHEHEPGKKAVDEWEQAAPSLRTVAAHAAAPPPLTADARSRTPDLDSSDCNVLLFFDLKQLFFEVRRLLRRSEENFTTSEHEHNFLTKVWEELRAQPPSLDAAYSTN